MSLMIDLSGMLAGMLSVYAKKRGWGKWKIFWVVSFAFFLLFSIYVVMFPSEKGVYVGILAGALFGVFVGSAFIVFMLIHERFQKD